MATLPILIFGVLIGLILGCVGTNSIHYALNTVIKKKLKM